MVLSGVVSGRGPCVVAGIAVELRPPLLREFPQWGSPFLCSTSRLLLRIRALAVPKAAFLAQCGHLVSHPRSVRLFFHSVLCNEHV